jgi:two-component SAPR family response regulator
MRIPGMCGLELANNIRELNDSVKIFLITAFDTFDVERNPLYRQAKLIK